MDPEYDDVVCRKCDAPEFDTIHAIINEAAQAYGGLIPADHLRDPYMPRDEFLGEIDAGVEFWGCDRSDALTAVMGIQRVRDVVLIRHAYTRPQHQGQGLGGGLLRFLVRRTRRPVLVGTWAGVARAIHFYERHDFAVVPAAAKDALLRKYWQVPAAQIDNSVVLANVPLERLSY